MSEVLSFPKLGIDVLVNRVAFEIGGFVIYWYGVIIAVAFLLGMLYLSRASARFGIHQNDALDVVFCAVVGGVIGARLYFVAFKWDNYSGNLMSIFSLREGGLAIYGGIIGAAIVAFIACKVKKLPFLPMADAGFTALLLGQGIGRWGNFFNMEAFGSNTKLPWGMTSEAIENYLWKVQEDLLNIGVVVDPEMPVHPTFFYESIWNIAGFILIAFVLVPRRKYDGQVFCAYLGWYGFGRAIIEGLRTDSLMLGSIRVSQMLAAVLFVASVAFWVWMNIKIKKAEKAPELYADSEISRERVSRIEEKIAQEKADAKFKRDLRKGKIILDAEEEELTAPSAQGGEPPADTAQKAIGKAQTAAAAIEESAKEASEEVAEAAKETSQTVIDAAEQAADDVKKIAEEAVNEVRAAVQEREEAEVSDDKNE